MAAPVAGEGRQEDCDSDGASLESPCGVTFREQWKPPLVWVFLRTWVCAGGEMEAKAPGRTMLTWYRLTKQEQRMGSHPCCAEPVLRAQSWCAVGSCGCPLLPKG